MSTSVTLRRIMNDTILGIILDSLCDIKKYYIQDGIEVIDYFFNENEIRLYSGLDGEFYLHIIARTGIFDFISQMEFNNSGELIDIETYGEREYKGLIFPSEN